MKNNEEFKNRCYGLSVIRSENSNFNADFTGNPRRLPDENGTVYATDKSLKYSIRKYWIDHGEKVFVWRTYKERDNKGDYTPSTLEERFLQLAEKKDTKPEDVFKDCIDVKFFGITFALKSGKGKGSNKNLSITGPLQISYGKNRYDENIIFSNDILSPYAKSEGDKSSTLGKENKGKEFYYTYDFSLNPDNIKNHFEECENIRKKMSLSKIEIDTLKEALKHGVTKLDTTSKKDSENALLLFVQMSDGSKAFLPAMKNLVNVKKNDEGRVVIDLSAVRNLLDDKMDDIEKIEVSYNCHVTEVSGLEDVDTGKWKIDDKM